MGDPLEVDIVNFVQKTTLVIWIAQQIEEVKEKAFQSRIAGDNPSVAEIYHAETRGMKKVLDHIADMKDDDTEDYKCPKCFTILKDHQNYISDDRNPNSECPGCGLLWLILEDGG